MSKTKLVLDNKKTIVDEKEIKAMFDENKALLGEQKTPKDGITIKDITLFVIFALCILAGDFAVLFIGFSADIPVWLTYFFGGLWGFVVGWAFTTKRGK